MVTLNLFAGVVALYARGGVAASGAAARTSRVAVSRGADPAGKGILAAGRFSDRRGPGGDSTGPADGPFRDDSGTGPLRGRLAVVRLGGKFIDVVASGSHDTDQWPAQDHADGTGRHSVDGRPHDVVDRTQPTTASTTPAGAGDPGTSAPAGDEPPPTQVIHPTWVI